ncbi:MAG: TRL-like family protein [Heliobacteriaceae bacterium]|jgi:hypothetical protein|nr:TRL-like family protein [Heliobacteriaceae bacterium]
MKKIIFLLFCLFLPVNLASALGILYTDTVYPIAATNLKPKSELKMGEAQSVSMYGLIETGHAGIHKAAEHGGITQIHYVDMKVKRVLFWSVRTTQVYGE